MNETEVIKIVDKRLAYAGFQILLILNLFLAGFFIVNYLEINGSVTRIIDDAGITSRQFPVVTNFMFEIGSKFLMYFLLPILNLIFVYYLRTKRHTLESNPKPFIQRTFGMIFINVVIWAISTGSLYLLLSLIRVLNRFI